MRPNSAEKCFLQICLAHALRTRHCAVGTGAWPQHETHSHPCLSHFPLVILPLRPYHDRLGRIVFIFSSYLPQYFTHFFGWLWDSKQVIYKKKYM